MTKRQTEGQLAEHYDRTRDLSDFDETVAEPVEVRRNVTISVRFSEREIEELRGAAEAAGLKFDGLHPGRGARGRLSDRSPAAPGSAAGGVRRRRRGRASSHRA
jgi:hypothetical protein